MRRLILLVTILAALLVAAWLAPMLLEQPGYVLMDVGQWRIETSVLVLVGAVLAAWIVISILVTLFRLPGRTLKRYRELRARRQLDQGLLALTEGDWARAERALGRALSDRGSTAGYLAAARAAQEQAAPERRDAWLQLAGRGFGRRHFITGLARARLLAGEGRPAEAVPVLEDLRRKKPRHTGVLRLLLQAYQDLERWREVRLLSGALRRAGIVNREKAAELAALAAVRELESAIEAGELEEAYASLGRKLRREPRVVAAYARRAIALGRPELAEPGLRRALEGERSGELLRLYAVSGEGDRKRRIECCQGWLAGEPENAEIHLALGRLYLAERDFDNARANLEIAVRTIPDPEAYAALGRVLDRSGELEAAAQCYRNALRLSRGRAADPLPLGES